MQARLHLTALTDVRANSAAVHGEPTLCEDSNVIMRALGAYLAFMGAAMMAAGMFSLVAYGTVVGCAVLVSLGLIAGMCGLAVAVPGRATSFRGSVNRGEVPPPSHTGRAPHGSSK